MHNEERILNRGQKDKELTAQNKWEVMEEVKNYLQKDVRKEKKEPLVRADKCILDDYVSFLIPDIFSFL